MAWDRKYSGHGAACRRRGNGAGASAELFTAPAFSQDKMTAFDAAAFGCPSMGAEPLEEHEFEPMVSFLDIKDKKIALFGSYGWGDGEWMRNWETSCKESGTVFLCGCHCERSAGRRGRLCPQTAWRCTRQRIIMISLLFDIQTFHFLAGKRSVKACFYRAFPGKTENPPGVKTPGGKR